MHAAFGSPCPSTFLRALRRNWLDAIPRLTSALFSANKPNSVATALGHLDQTRQGLDSTKGKRVIATLPSPDPTPNPPDASDELPTVDPYDPEGVDTFDDSQSPLLFCRTFAAADIDASGRFPVSSSRRKEYHLLRYFKGYVHVEPLPSRTQTAYIDAYKRTYAYWTQFGPVPDIVRLDNESVELEKYIKTFAIFQYFPPGNHRANRAEQVMMCTWKNHFIATLATASSIFPLNQWDRLIKQAKITLNCLLPWHPDPS
jgi:hypothetical protein